MNVPFFIFIYNLLFKTFLVIIKRNAQEIITFDKQYLLSVDLSFNNVNAFYPPYLSSSASFFKNQISKEVYFFCNNAREL